MSNKYKSISGKDVLDELIKTDLNAFPVIDCINLVNIASLLKTSRYQVKKYMDLLVEFGVAEMSRTVIYGEDYILPYCGYKLTDTIKIKSGDNIDSSLNRSLILQTRAKYHRKKAEYEKIFEECYGAN